MKNSLFFKGLRLWVQGLLLLALRWAQLKSGFDPATGLARQSAPGIILAGAILLLAAAELALCFLLSGDKRSYSCCFQPVERRTFPLLAAGSLLLVAGCVLLAVSDLPGAGRGALKIAAAAVGIAAAAGLLLFARQTGNGEERTFPLLPAMVFSVLLLLVVYLPQDSNPVLAQYYLPVLAAALTACAFYQLAGFACREARLRWFVLFGDLAVPLCLAALADSVRNPGQALIFAGCALVLTVFLLLRRAEPLPEKGREPAGITEQD